MEKVLVTGAYGFLGSYVVRELTGHGYYVRAFGRNEDRLKEVCGENVEPFVGDLCDLDAVIKAAEGMDYVIHCGARLGSWGRKSDFFKTNVGGTENVIRACRVNKVKRLVFTSSPSAFALTDNFDITEDNYNADNHIGFYIESKIKAERIVREQKDVPWSVIRPRGICGVGDKNMFPSLIRANNTIGIPIFEKGEVVVDLACVENVAYALRLCMEKDKALYRVYNITNGEPRKVRDLAEAMFDKIGEKPKFTYLPFGLVYGAAYVLEGIFKLFGIYNTNPPVTRADICTLGRSQVFDITRAREELGYKPIISLDEMIDNYAEDYCGHKKGRNE